MDYGEYDGPHSLALVLGAHGLVMSWDFLKFVNRN